MITKISSATIGMADILHLAGNGDLVESSRIHVGPTTAALPHFLVTAGTKVKTQIVDMTFGDFVCTPHLSVSRKGTIDVGSPQHISYMMLAHTSDETLGLSVGDNVADWHLGKVKNLFPEADLVTSSNILQQNSAVAISVIEAAWEFICRNEVHCFRHYIESDGLVVKREPPEDIKDVLSDLAMVTGSTGWKVPNIITILLDILLGSKKDGQYYHLCGGSMWKYIDNYGYHDLIKTVLEKMHRFGRGLYLVNSTSFRVFSLKEESKHLDDIWYVWKKWKRESVPKKKTQLEAILHKQVRDKKLPWYDKCEGKMELTQHDLGTADEIYVPNWAIYASFEELSEFVGFTVKIWKSGKK